MRRHSLSLLTALLSACSGGHSASPPPPDGPALPAFAAPCPATACAEGPSISSAAALVSEIESHARWPAFAPYTTGCLPASDDLHVTGTITVQPDAVTPPADCQTGCRQQVMFRLDDAPPGVTCDAPEDYFDYTLCGGITVTDATLRFRVVEQDVHPAWPSAIPIVDILPACATPCAAGEFACDATHTCWASARDQCAYCLGGTNEACACWTGSAFAADGTSCELWPSNDTIVSGTCHAGTCAPN